VRRSLAAACIAAAACAQLEPLQEDEALPPLPREADLIEFDAAPSGVRFLIDRSSIGLGDDLVRYTLVAQSAAGAQNVSHEGIRCSTAEVRIYAVARGAEWIRSSGAWRAIRADTAQRWHQTLNRDLCPLKKPVGSRREALEALARRPYLSQ